jgi:hypothetical protein
MNGTGQVAAMQRSPELRERILLRRNVDWTGLEIGLEDHGVDGEVGVQSPVLFSDVRILRYTYLK